MKVVSNKKGINYKEVRATLDSMNMKDLIPNDGILRSLSGVGKDLSIMCNKNPVDPINTFCLGVKLDEYDRWELHDELKRLTTNIANCISGCGERFDVVRIWNEPSGRVIVAVQYNTTEFVRVVLLEEESLEYLSCKPKNSIAWTTPFAETILELLTNVLRISNIPIWNLDIYPTAEGQFMYGACDSVFFDKKFSFSSEFEHNIKPVKGEYAVVMYI